MQLSIKTLLAACLMLFASGAIAQDEGSSGSPAAAPTDPGFSGYFDEEAFRQAAGTMNAGAIADLALKLAEGERVLLRPHASGINSTAVLGLAVRVATETKDAATLERLAVAAEKGKLETLQAQIAAAKQVAGASRAADSPKVAVNELQAGTLAVYELLTQKIQFAKSIGDRAALEEIRDTASEYVDLTDELQAAIKKAATEALAEIPEQGDDAAMALAALAGGARISAGTLAISTSTNSPGGQLTIEAPPGKPAVPVCRCNLRNVNKEAVKFTCHGTGREYTIEPGKSMSFTIYGKYIPAKVAAPPVIAGAGTLAIDLSGKETTSVTPEKIVPPILMFWRTTSGIIKIKLPWYSRVPVNGNLDLVKGSDGKIYLKRR